MMAVVPRELFLRMAALALVAILLSAALSLQAFAIGEDFQDSGITDGVGGTLPPVESGDEPQVPLPELPGGTLEDLEDEPAPLPEGILDSLAEDVHFIRQSIELLLYCIFPLGVALFLFVAFCRWFYYTFLELVL